MIYMLRVLYAWLLPPGLYLLLFITTYIIYVKTKKRSWFIVPFVISYMLSTYAISSMLINPLERYYKQPSVSDLKGVQAIVVLGGGTYYGVSDIDHSGQLTSCSANRLFAGLRLYKLLKVPILISGTKEEVEISRHILKACGVSEKDILVENKSGNTAQNASFTKIFCQQKELKKIILVTSANHLPRAVLLFQREGMNVIPYPTDYRTHGVDVFNLHVFTPTYEGLGNSAIALKEYLAILAVNLDVL